MNKFTILTIYLLILSLITKVDIVFAAVAQETDHEEIPQIICADTTDQSCADTYKNSELKTIKLKPKIRLYEHQKKELINSNELTPFIGGSGQVR